MDMHHDMIGPGAALLASRPAPTGKRVLAIEPGDHLPYEKAGWDIEPVFLDGKHPAAGTWHGAAVNPTPTTIAGCGTIAQ